MSGGGGAGAERRLIDNERADVMSAVINHSAGAATPPLPGRPHHSERARAASFYDGFAIIITTPDPLAAVVSSPLAGHTCLHASFRNRENRFRQRKKQIIHSKLFLFIALHRFRMCFPRNKNVRLFPRNGKMSKIKKRFENTTVA